MVLYQAASTVPKSMCERIFGTVVTLATPGDTVPPVLWRSRRKAGKFMDVSIKHWMNVSKLHMHDNALDS
uniref:Uncharacterized protein n=1 Tax=Anopheles farauti TaxID=69004 RepID=A0A182Q7J4_9DIPT